MAVKAKCERTGATVELSKGFFVADALTGEWIFTSGNSEQTSDYAVLVGEIVRSPEAFVDWMAHLSEKTWFKPDRFFAFMERFRRENDLFNHL